MIELKHRKAGRSPNSDPAGQTLSASDPLNKRWTKSKKTDRQTGGWAGAAQCSVLSQIDRDRWMDGWMDGWMDKSINK
jgi:hypothetical protein